MTEHDFHFTRDDEHGGIQILKYTGTSSEIVIPDSLGGMPVVSVGSYVFMDTEETDIDGVKARVAKSDRISPVSVVLPETLKHISYCAFYGCDALKDITVPDSVTEIGSSAFAMCTMLENISLPSGLTIINKSLFRRCEKLKKIVIPENVSVIDFIAFENCTSLESITLPANLERIGTRAFCGCSSLRKISFPKREIDFGNGVFAETGIVNIVIPETKCISEAMFHKCTSLEQVVVQSGLEEISSDAFSDCENLESAVFPESVKKVGDRAFYGCENLMSLPELPEGIQYGKNVWTGTSFL